jgi:uncharacterized Zn-binding protein involved in type VI secretion
MPGAMRINDSSVGIVEAFYPSPATGGSPNVKINTRFAMRVNDSYEDHIHLPPLGTVHTGRVAETGSSTVRINGSPAHRELDLIGGGRSYTVIREDVQELCGQQRPGFISWTALPGGPCYVIQNGTTIIDDDCCATQINTYQDLYFEPCNDIALQGSNNVFIGGSPTSPGQSTGSELISSTLLSTQIVGS